MLKSFIGAKRKSSRENSVNRQNNAETWNADWEEWEGVEIKNTAPPSEPPLEQEVDLFQDMKPVIHATKKVRISKEERPNLKQFAVDPTFVQSTTSELMDWPEDTNINGGGWENDSVPNDLIRHSQEMLRKKRQEERESRRQQQQRTPTGNNVQLGATRITT